MCLCCGISFVLSSYLTSSEYQSLPHTRKLGFYRFLIEYLAFRPVDLAVGIPPRACMDHDLLSFCHLSPTHQHERYSWTRE